MKPLVPMIAAAVMALAPTSAAAQPRGPQPRMQQLMLKPPGNFVVGHSQRVGTQQIVEWVPRGQTVKRYTKMITLNSFVPRAGIGPSSVMESFSSRYRNACRGTRVSHMSLGGGKTGIRMDCPRSPMTGKPETVFARAIPMRPAMAIVQYMTTYTAPPGEAAFAREFLGNASVR